MQILIRTLVAMPLLSLCVTVAGAAEIERQGVRLRVTGPLDSSGLTAFTDQLTSGEVRTVVFQDSRGGNADMAEAYARVIRTADVYTEVVGQCSAACAYAFLAGKTHHFGRGPQVNSVLIPLGARPAAADLIRWSATLHGSGEAPARPMRLSTQVDASATAAGVTNASNAAASDAASLVPAGVKEAWHPDQGALFTATPTLFGRVYSTYYCDGTQGRDLSKCEALPDADPYRLGVLN